MRRRTVLAAFGTTLAATAGCLADGGDSGGDDPTDAPTTQPPTDTPTDGGTPTGSPSGDPGDSRFAGEPCPSFAEADRTVCYHTSESPDVVLVPARETFRPTTGDDSVELLRFTLENRSDRQFGLNPYAWRIDRRTDGGWDHVAPDAYVEPWVMIPAGATYEWLLGVEARPSPKGPDGQRVQSITVDLSDGVYAFSVSGAFGDGPQEGRRVECVALFAVERA